MRTVGVRFWLVVAAVLVAGPAWAASVFELTGAHDSTNSQTVGLFGKAPSLAYFNPALLPGAGDGISVSFFFLGQDLGINLDPRPGGVDVDGSVYDARLLNPDGTTSRLGYRPLATADLRRQRGAGGPDTSGLYLGLGTVKELIPGHLALGLYAVIPTRDFQAQEAFFADEREQFFSNSLHFELLGDRLRATALALALGTRILDWLSVGAGVTMSTVSSARSHVYVGDATYQETAEINADLGVDVRFIPHASVVVELLSGLRITSSVHLPYESRVEGASDVQMWNYPYPDGKQSLEQVFGFSQGYEPLRVSAGTAWEGRVRAFDYGLAALVRWSRWSQYVDRHGESPVATWADTVAGSLGGRLGKGAATFGLDLSFTPSPVPNQTGRSNYVDNHRLGIGGGWAYDFQIMGHHLAAGIQAQLGYLMPRDVAKNFDSANPVFDEFPDSVHVQTGEVLSGSAGFQTNNPGYPGFGSAGWLYGAGFWFKTGFGPGAQD